MAYTPPLNPIDFHFTGTGYAAPVGSAVDFQFLDSQDVARLSGDIIGFEVNISINSALFAGTLTTVEYGATSAPTFNSDINFFTGDFVLSALGFKSDLARLTGTIDAGIRRALFAGTLAKPTGKFLAGFYASHLKRDLITVKGSFKATPATFKRDLITVKGSFKATPANFKSDLIKLTGTFYPEVYKAYLDADIKPFTGTFTHNTVGYVVVSKRLIVSRRYRAKITGNFDYDFPISSISASFRQTGAGTMTIVCPDGINYGSTIIDQSRVNNHTITIYADEIYSDGTIETTTFIMTSNSLSYAQGSRSFSITINGSVSFNIPATPRQYVAEGVQYETLQGNGGIRIRCDLNKDLRPKDKLLISSGREIDVGIVQYIISANTRAMEVAEILI
jgi:hypothetical protein